MIKLDELMALADEFAEMTRGWGWGEDCLKSRAALESALKAVLEDAERFNWLEKQHWWSLTPDPLKELRDRVDRDMAKESAARKA
jgi:hypothetical protein